jgi:hypothetical protein
MLEWLEIAALTVAAGDGLPSAAAATAAVRTNLLQTASKAGYRLDLLLKGSAG